MTTKDIFIIPLWFGKQIEKLKHDPHIYFNFIYFQCHRNFSNFLLLINNEIKKSIFFHLWLFIIYYLGEK